MPNYQRTIADWSKQDILEVRVLVGGPQTEQMLIYSDLDCRVDSRHKLPLDISGRDTVVHLLANHHVC
jgi:hypothetical protein